MAEKVSGMVAESAMVVYSVDIHGGREWNGGMELRSWCPRVELWSIELTCMVAKG